MADHPLGAFHPLVRRWFTEAVGEPTEVQRLAWPRIAAGEHLLATAPTGSGKTLAAFLWALDRLLTGAWPAGRTRVLYVSPLKALNTDVGKNLLAPLAELTGRFRAAGRSVPELQVVTRSGDTPESERRRMRRQPPEILITTPESLNILLTSEGGRRLFDGLETVILDEIHAVVGQKRGVHLLTAVERLVPLAGEVQRLALSATVKPLERVAELVGGWRLEAGEGEARYRRRRVAIAEAAGGKRYDVRVRSAAGAAGTPADEPPWDALVPDLRRRILANRSTLLFANSRRMAEKVTRLLNEGQREEIAYSHHGSLSREVRKVVEERLKAGELKAIVATSSLELGIDVGALDEVVLIRTPPSVASAVQRVGRAGHQVGAVSRGVLYPLEPRDLLDAAVVARAVVEGDIEEVAPITAPLDVLAQVILSMASGEVWQVDALYDRLRSAAPYHELPRRSFDLVLEMLAGRYADSRIRELQPRLVIDRLAGTVRSRPGVARILYLAGGTIPDRGYFTLRLESSLARLGELDEEFVWERSAGDTFTLGAQGWQIRKITHNDVLVAPAKSATAMAPFWRADARDRRSHLSERLAGFLEVADTALGSAAFRRRLEAEHALEPAAAERLVAFLRQQKEVTAAPLPHRHHVVAERLADPTEPDGKHRWILHTVWGGTVNRPYALALAVAWEERYGTALEAFHDDDCLLLRLPGETTAEELLGLVAPERVEELVRRRLERTGFFGARFRAAASTALLLPRAGFRHRTPLWLQRARSKKLLDAVARYGDFPVVVESWRSCLEDDLEVEVLQRRLEAVRSGEVRSSEVATAAPSPFAANLLWRETNRLMYEDDTPAGGGGAALRPELLRELVFSSRLRPRLPAALVEELRQKLQRTAPGYAPPPGEVAAWVAERLLLGEPEWRELTAAVARDHGVGEAEVTATAAERVVRLVLPGAAPAVVAAEALPRLCAAFDTALADLPLRSLADGATAPPAELRRAVERLAAERAAGTAALGEDAEGEPAEGISPLALWLGEWLRFYGPLAAARLEAALPAATAETLRGALEELAEDQRVVVDRLLEGSAELEVCDAENLEVLLRWLRRERRPSFEPLGPEHLPLFLADHQGLGSPGDVETLQRRLESLFGYPAAAGAWETEILPARLAPYHPAWLDSVVQESGLLWLGCGPQRSTFALPPDLDLLLEPTALPATGDEGEGGGAPPPSVAGLFPDPRARYGLSELAAETGRSTAEVTARLWELAWEGAVSNDAFVTLRRGIETGFRPLEATPTAGRPRGGRRGFGRWQATRPFAGSWLVVPRPAAPRDAVEAEELVKDRVRLLLARYGLLFRQLLARELPPLQWGQIFRTLRLMELSGELLAGHFFTGIEGLQFVSHEAFRRLQDGLPEERVWWLNASDPASLAGVDVAPLKSALPPRLATTHLVHHGTRLVLVSKQSGKALEIHVAPDDPHLGAYLEPLKVMLTRAVRPRRSVAVHTINGERARESPYLEAMATLFRVTRETSGVRLWKRYGA